MVQTIDGINIITSREARETYENYYIGFVTTEQNLSDPDNEMGYVVYIMDSYDEGFTIPRRTNEGHFISIISGYAVGGIEIGAIYFGGVYYD